MVLWIALSLLCVPFGVAFAGESHVLLNAANPQAVKSAQAGKLRSVNAAWWGFDASDSTNAIQAALDSGARSVVIPYMGQPWIVRPLQLRSHQEITIEPGVVVLAKKGEFRGGGDSLFTAKHVSDLKIRGYGATLRMNKRDYQNPPYSKAEWRMGISIEGCRRVLVEGLRIESSGGDGIYVNGAGEDDWSEDVTIRNVVAYDNHRQGISIISVVNLVIENCVFANTWGTAPEAGIDIEPNTERNRLVNCLIRNSTFENNNGDGIEIYLKPLSAKSYPISIRFDHCWVRMTSARLTAAGNGPKDGINGIAGIGVGAIRDDGPNGKIEFVDCVVEDTSKESARVFDKSAARARVRFVNCSFRNPWTGANPNDAGPRVPILFHLRNPDYTHDLGGVDFENCYVFDPVARPAVRLEEESGESGLHDVHGEIYVNAPGKPSLKLGSRLKNVDLRVHPIKSP